MADKHCYRPHHRLIRLRALLYNPREPGLISTSGCDLFSDWGSG